jgi:probable F420-dependent oxidoreductase
VSAFFEDPRKFGELCRKIEDWGFDSVWLADGLTRNIVEPLPSLAYASAFTSRIKLGTCIYVVPVRHPLVTAKLTSTLDYISGGRFVLGVGVGWREDEFKATGIPFQERGKVADECVQIIRQAWESGMVDFQGGFYKISDARMEHPPVQKPRPQLWIGGNGSQAIARAARFGDYWIPTDYTIDEYKQGVPRLTTACKRFSRSPGDVSVASHLLVILDEGKSEAELMAKNVAGSLHTGTDELKEWALVGDIAQVTKRIEAYNDAGVSYHVLNFGTNVRDEARIELFAREVLPSFT